MIKDRIQFKNLHSLYSDAGSFETGTIDGSKFSISLRKWKVRGIKTLFVLGENSKKNLKVWISALNREKIAVIFLPSNLQNLENKALLQIHSLVKSKLEKNSAELIFESRSRIPADFFIQSFQLYRSLSSLTNGGDSEEFHPNGNLLLNNYHSFLQKSLGMPSALPPEKPMEESVSLRETKEIAKSAAVQQISVEDDFDEMEVVEDETPAESEKKETSRIPFKPSRITIKIKLMAIISSIILSALSVMIFLASRYFREDSIARVQENNLNLTEIIGQKIELDLSTIQLNTRTFAASISQSSLSDKKQKELSSIFFTNNPNYLFIGFAENRDGLPVFTRTFTNDYYLVQNDISADDMSNLHTSNMEAYVKSFSGVMVAHNASPGFKIPVLGFSTSYGNGIIITYIDPAGFIKSFQSSGITKTFMVDNKGNVIAHPDSQIVLSRSNFLDLPIVKKMLESNNLNGLSNFKDKDGKSYLGSFQKLDKATLGVISVVEEKEALKAVDNIQRRNLYLMALVLNAALLIVFFYANSISVPLINLVGATRKIEDGNFEVELNPASRDEIGILTNSFTHMAKGLGEREKMKDAFGKFVNKEIAERVIRGELALGGESKNAAIFFSDLRNFTAMSEKMTPEGVVEYLNMYFTRMVSCVNQTNGIVDKYIGDAIMAHWGAIKTFGNDTENAVNAALMMRKSLLEFNLDAGTEKKPYAKFGCGINTGEVISGQIGSEERLEYTVIGDSVNLASRIEALNKPFGSDILISQGSYDLVKNIFKVEKMPSIMVKGKSKPQTIYAVLGRFDDPDCPRDMKEVRRIVGIDFDESKLGGETFEEEKEVKYEVLKE